MTIKDLAEKTGYGVATISRVLNDQPNVSEKARKAILQAVEESGFQINTNAKQLKAHATSILVIVKGTSNEMFSEMVETIQNRVAQTQYPLYVDYMDEDGNEVRRALQLCREKKPLGILFLGGNRQHFLKDFGKIDIPCVLVTNDASELPFPNLSSVCTDDRQAARCAMDAMIAMGHRKFAIVGGDREKSDTSRLRFEGCMEEFRRQGIEFDVERYYRSVRYSHADGYAAMMGILRSAPEVTAVFAVSDVMAIGAARAIHDAGRRVPEDISLVGFDGLPICNYYQPRLTTVVQQTNFMAETSFRMLDDCIRHGTGARHILAPSELSSGGSVLNIR